MVRELGFKSFIFIDIFYCCALFIIEYKKKLYMSIFLLCLPVIYNLFSVLRDVFFQQNTL